MGEILQLGHNVVALCDVDAGQIKNSQQQHGDGVAKAAAYSDYRVLLDREKSLDAVVIATPDHWHAPICRAAMQAGKHVYCEKPLTQTKPPPHEKPSSPPHRRLPDGRCRVAD